ncbi:MULTISPECIES: peptidase inhibitor family I36 protein [Amycolatopsis]|uniref:Peptidase inhibitor family I36 n=2 Tax=Amycolatopsis TaxID=1813 RepID=A0A1I3ZJ15_9PSEU|nr:peptidase inhibitor family I36 protein [Amycolatopsis sacchari]SFK43661.1 Peptidase inhibitor family I36 [Amycolatopsis sacchari]
MKLRAHLSGALVFAALSLLCGAGAAQADPGKPGNACEAGEFCAWTGESYTDAGQRLDLRTANPGECLLLPGGIEARSFINQLDRDVTVYQDAKCSTEGDFTTYPGKGTFVPRAPFVVRAIQIWDMV